MPQSLSCLLSHLIFSTKNREAVLTRAVQSELHPYIGGVLGKIDCPSLQIGGTEDHVHIFFSTCRTRTVASIVETVKTSSSKWIKGKGREFAGFHWQSGYAAFSVSSSEAAKVIDYIRDQADHHKIMTFQDEYRKLLGRHKILFDEGYAWD